MPFIALTHQLSFSVIAEDVESDGQLALLCFQHCDVVQRFLLGPPMTAEELGRWLEDRHGLDHRQARPA